MAERDFPVGHPSACDYDPKSKEAIEWARINIHPAGERDFPIGHPGAADNPNRVEPTHPMETARDYSRPETVRPPMKPVEEVAADANAN